MVEFLVAHLRFEFWFFESRKYVETVKTVLNVLWSLLKENPTTVVPFAHYVFAFCFIQRNESLEQCKAISDLIGWPKFSPREVAEIEEEAVKWACSCGDISIAIRACDLLKQIVRNRNSQKCDRVLSSVSIISHLLHESQVDDFAQEVDLISSLLEIAFLFDPSSKRLCEFAIEFIRFGEV
jgi:hypothetical protein